LVWFDNVELFDADLTVTNPDDYFFFDYNPTLVDMVVSLDGTYVDVTNQSFSGSVVVPSFGSVVLIKVNDSVVATCNDGVQNRDEVGVDCGGSFCSACVDPCVPVLEVCNNFDDDCDGSVDEDLIQATTCGVGECDGNVGEEVCVAGIWVDDTCDSFGGSVDEDDFCDDGLDNDCDGVVDDDDSDCGSGSSGGGSGGGSNSYCGDGSCKSWYGEDCGSCLVDCACGVGFVCDVDVCVVVSVPTNNDSDSDLDLGVDNQSGFDNSSVSSLGVGGENGTEITPDPDEEETDSTSEGFDSNFVYFGVLLFVLVLVGLFGFVFRDRIFGGGSGGGSSSGSEVSALGSGSVGSVSSSSSGVGVVPVVVGSPRELSASDYVDQMRGLGYDDLFIKDKLKVNGYGDEEINDFFKK